MRFCTRVLCLALLSILVFDGQPSWSQETAPDATQMETGPAVAEETSPPAVDEPQSAVPDQIQPMPSDDSLTTAPGESQPAVRITEAVVCQDVVDRAPVGAGDVFAKEVSRIYCFTRVAGADPGAHVIHNWYYQGNLKASVNLTVGSSDYRTWSYKTMMPQWTGEWKVEILTADGAPLENIIFVLK